MSNYLTKEQVNQLNEKHGWFEFGDAQSDVSMAFAQDAITMYLAATEAAKATGTAGELPPHDGYIDLYDESGRIGRVTSEKAWFEESVRAYGRQCAEALKKENSQLKELLNLKENRITDLVANLAASAARQPAPALPVSELAKKLNALDMAIAHSTNLTPHSKPRRLLAAIIHEVCSDAAMAATAAPVLSDEQAWALLAEICGTKVIRVGTRRITVLNEITDMATAGETVRAILAATRSQP